MFKYKTEHHQQSSPKKTYASVKKNQSLKEYVSKGESYKRTKSSKRHHRKSETSESKEQRDKAARNRLQLRYIRIVFWLKDLITIYFRQHKKSSSIESRSTNSSRDASNDPVELQKCSNNVLNVLSCPDDGLDDMTRQRHVYETAFDCRISKSDDDLDQIERVTNHPVLLQWNNDRSGSEPSKGSISTLHKSTKSKPKEDKPSHTQEDNNQVLNLSQNMQV